MSHPGHLASYEPAVNGGALLSESARRPGRQENINKLSMKEIGVTHAAELFPYIRILAGR
jgi:hypothetical protein